MSSPRPKEFPGAAPSTEGWRKVDTLDAWPNPFMRAEVARFHTPSRQEMPVTWTVVYRPAAIAVAPVTPEGNFVMIRQERIPAESRFWEFPAGQIDEPHFRSLDPESPEAGKILRDTVHRELQEEAGYELAPDGELAPLGRFFTSPGFTDELVYLFLAKNVIPHEHGTNHDEGEAISEVRAFPLEDIRRRVASFEVQDSLTLALFARIAAAGA